MLLKRRKNERYFNNRINSPFCMAINNNLFKSYKQWFLEAYSNNSIVFLRSVQYGY